MTDLQITEVKIRKLSEEGKMKAIVSVILDECFAVHDIKVVEHEGRLFVAMPSKRMPDGEYKDIVHPINQETRTVFHEKIMEQYNRALAEKEQTAE